MYKPRYLNKQKPAQQKGIEYQADKTSLGRGTLFLNGEDVSRLTTKAVITLEPGCVPTVELTRISNGDVSIVGDVDTVQKGLSLKGMDLYVGGEKAKKVLRK